MKVLITGASGFLGRHLVVALQQAGHTVRALARTAASAPAGCEVAVGDLTRPLPCGVADGVDAVVHLAAALHGPWDEHRRVTVDGTRRLLQALMPQRPHLVLASSFSVYDWNRVGAQVDEGAPLLCAEAGAEQDAYARAKLAQEALVRDWSAAHGQRLTVLRPAAIWGEGEQGFHALGVLRRRLWAVLGPSRIPRLTHVHNCADAFVAALDPRAIGHTFNVDDGFEATAWQWAQDLAARRPAPPRVPVPVPVLAVAGAAAAPLLLLSGRSVPGLLMRDRLQARFGPARAGHAALQQHLGWHPPLSRQAALERFAA